MKHDIWHKNNAKRAAYSTRGTDINPETAAKLRERGEDAHLSARKALSVARDEAVTKEADIRSAIGPSSVPEQHYEKSVKALPPPPERDEFVDKVNASMEEARQRMYRDALDEAARDVGPVDPNEFIGLSARMKELEDE